MVFLVWLESLRTPVVSGFMAAVTYLGDELFFMAIALLIFWCVSKRQGYYLFVACFFGLIFNQFAKLWFRIPRPWVLKKDFTIVEAARAGATGYSFPSGHTQNIVAISCVLGFCTKKTWVRVTAIVLALLVPFSRMYLGVHTPLDVGCAFLAAIMTCALLYPFFTTDARMNKCLPWLISTLFVLGVAYAIFTYCYPFPADIDIDNLASGQKNGMTIIGSAIGFLTVFFLESRFVRFDTRAPLIAQILKFVIGLGLLVGLRAGLKPLLGAFLPGYFETCVRYFLMVLFGGLLWPMTFPLFRKIGAKKDNPTN